MSDFLDKKKVKAGECDPDETVVRFEDVLEYGLRVYKALETEIFHEIRGNGKRRKSND